MSVLGLIAGSGPLPFEVASGARERGLELAIVAIEDNTDPAIEARATRAFTWLAAGELGRLIDFMKGAGASQVILAGAVAKREMLAEPAKLRPDARAIRLLSRLGERGDDAILRAVAGELEGEGLPVVDSTLYLGGRMTPVGVIAGPEPSAAARADLELGMRVVRGIGGFDIGQAVLVHRGTVLAVEAVEGTDAMLERGARFGRGAVLVKCAKPGQDLRFDVPVIGPGTVALAERHGLAAIGLEAGRTLILERETALAAAAEAGVSVVGLEEGA